MLSVDFLIVDRIPCGRFHANISRIPNIGETVSLAFKGNVNQYFEVVDVITAIPCNACGLQEFDAAYARSAEPGMTAISTLNRIYIRLGQKCSRMKGYRLSVSL